MREKDLTREVLRRLEETVGRSYLRQILDKVIYDLSCKFEDIKNVKIPEDPSELELEGLSAEAKEEFLLVLIDTLGFVGRRELREYFMKKLREIGE